MRDGLVLEANESDHIDPATDEGKDPGYSPLPSRKS